MTVCEPDEPVGVEGVGRALHLVEGEGNAGRLAGVDDRLVDALRVGAAAEFGGEIIGARHAAGGHVGVELEGPPGDVGGKARALRQRGFEPALADEAPGANDVGDDVDVHRNYSTVDPAGDALKVKTGDGMKSGIYDETHLARGRANYAALSPLSFLARSAAIYPEKIAVIHGERRFTYAEFHARCRRLADALRKRGVGKATPSR